MHTKLRFSNDRLNTEPGRYTRAPVFHLRTCNICNSLEFEGDFHFICVCDKYDDLTNVVFFMTLLKLLSALIH